MIKELTCQALVAGCPDCAAVQDYQNKIGHSCGTSTTMLETLCFVIGEDRRRNPEFHRLSHQPERCSGCGRDMWNELGLDLFESRPCRSGQCVDFYCSHCQTVHSSNGPVDCPTCGSYGRHRMISRMHRQYRQKRRHW